MGFWDNAKPTASGCWEWQRYCAANGYGRLSVSGRVWYAHRFAFFLATGTDPDNLYVLHSCDNPKCVNPAHLSLGTQVENMRQMFDRGRGRPGRNNVKLSDADVAAIRADYARGVLPSALAHRFGINRSHVFRLVRRQQRAHAP